VRAHPHLYELNTWPWLEALSERAGRPVTLGTVPDEVWDGLRDAGIDFVYLMGVWRRSAFGRDLARSTPQLFAAYDAALPDWQEQDVVGSAFCIAGYEPDPRVGSFDELDAMRARLHARGMQLILDFIPNHTGFDHPWIRSHPERYVTVGKGEYDRAPEMFRAVEMPSGEMRFIACGRDPYFPPWTDVAQLNYANPETRRAMIDALQAVARHADGARCDMAMLVLSDVFARTWSHVVGTVTPFDFWSDADAAVPGFVLLAEVYWDLEWRLQTAGFDFTYDKTLYDRVLLRHVQDARAHLTADLSYQRRLARFAENHDEPRSVTAFGDRIRAAAVAVSTLPGLRFFHDGQFEGRRARLPVQIGRFPAEAVDEPLAGFYRGLLEAIDAPVFHDGDWRLLEVARLDDSSDAILAWQWARGRVRRVVVVNLGSATAHARIPGIDLPDGDVFAFQDLVDGQSYERHRDDLAANGLYVRLETGQPHIFSIESLPR
jgi:glycosidase